MRHIIVYGFFVGVALFGGGGFGASTNGPAGRGYNRSHADVAQLVEHQLPKLRVAGSNPVVRSMKPQQNGALFFH